ncbi:thiamine/thiamine pyrophosphate ABC transporter permease ThiP [Vibrio sp. JC009]|uniref:thiamine/thiamine pyrophosphate ABC transporter permease ThiP n=1 Tax=Vibrio sp. JC009 TaxID=2912314 RepID=UPI0023B1F0DF|nr:thiamine/thiamine pyrophosphate ABC transporter permease ThiP [Vibrio sp. JC009]WED22132.1 thiamine/thiamine pyrophosphate ABC transporter permease ThiP [Vibrio sp. JC009]
MQKTPISGLLIAFIILAFVVSALSALLTHSPSLDITHIWADPYYRHVTKFSFYQAFLSTLISVVLAIPVAHALFRREFRGKKLLLKLFASTLVLPVLVGVFGLLAIYGNSGLLAELFVWFDKKLPFSIYGLNGILLAHVFFNLPYASRLFLQSLESIPLEQHKLCAHLGMSHWYKFKWVEWPRIRQQLPQICGLVFMLCFTSFATVMALGGGPESTTIEVAVYQAIKFDFDLQAGAILAIWQMLVCTVLYLTIQKLGKGNTVSSDYRNETALLINDDWKSRLWDWLWISMSVLLVVPPLLMVIISGINPKSLSVLGDISFWKALQTSVSIASVSAAIALLAGAGILLTSRSWRLRNMGRSANRLELVGTVILVTPGLVVSTGLFLLFRQFGDVFSFAFFIVIAVNSLMALPYVIKTLAQPMFQVEHNYQQLCASLGMKGWNRLWLVECRALRKPISHAFALGFMVSIGDLSAIALFGSQDFRTLPLYLYQLLGSYQMEAAAMVSLCLFLLTLATFSFVERMFRRL